MPRGNARITLIGVGLAKVGVEFVFNGPTNECETCKLKNTCLNLDIGRRYRIVSVRGNMKHDCALQRHRGQSGSKWLKVPVWQQSTLKARLWARESCTSRNDCEVLDCKNLRNCAIRMGSDGMTST